MGTWINKCFDKSLRKIPVFLWMTLEKLTHYLEKNKVGFIPLTIYKVEFHEDRRSKCERLYSKILEK